VRRSGRGKGARSGKPETDHGFLISTLDWQLKLIVVGCLFPRSSGLAGPGTAADHRGDLPLETLAAEREPAVGRIPNAAGVRSHIAHPTTTQYSVRGLISRECNSGETSAVGVRLGCRNRRIIRAKISPLFGFGCWQRMPHVSCAGCRGYAPFPKRSNPCERCARGRLPSELD
jgi:hypothetical protein